MPDNDKHQDQNGCHMWGEGEKIEICKGDRGLQLYLECFIFMRSFI